MFYFVYFYIFVSSWPRRWTVMDAGPLRAVTGFLSLSLSLSLLKRRKKEKKEGKPGRKINDERLGNADSFFNIFLSLSLVSVSFPCVLLLADCLRFTSPLGGHGRWPVANLTRLPSVWTYQQSSPYKTLFLVRIPSLEQSPNRLFIEMLILQRFYGVMADLVRIKWVSKHLHVIADFLELICHDFLQKRALFQQFWENLGQICVDFPPLSEIFTDFEVLLEKVRFRFILLSFTGSYAH